jgi:DNA-binding IclR family transcriptional regulator
MTPRSLRRYQDDDICRRKTQMGADQETMSSQNAPRGIEILRTFRPGVGTLGNGEISERTGLPRSTVSRLTRTLVNSGMLDEVRTDRTYRLAASVISMSHAMRTGSPVLDAIGPMMRAESAKRRL